MSVAGFVVSSVGGDVSSPVSGAGDALLPNLLPNLTLWLDASDGSTIMESGNSVSAWSDKSENGNDATQGTPGLQPNTNTNTQNSRNVITYNGSNSLSLASGVYSIPNGSNTLFAVCKTNNSTAQQRVLNMTTTNSSDYGLIYTPTVGEVIYYNNLSGLGVAATGVSDTNYNIFSCWRDGTDVSISVNGGAASANNTRGGDVPAIDEASLGAFQTSANFLDGDIAEVIIYSRLLTTPEITAINQYLSNKWAITLA